MTRVFVSFDYDHDRALYGSLVAQSEMRESPFTIVDHSLPSAVHDGDWKRQVRDRIRQVDVVVFICGVNTHSAGGVAAEMTITRAERKYYFLLRGYRRHACSKPKGARRKDAMHRWKWTNLSRLLDTT